MTKLLEITVNCPSDAVASEIAMAIVGAGLAAASNVSGEINSSYRWKGAIQNRREVALRLKTTTACFDRIVEQIRSIHPYETPSITGQIVDVVDHDYLQWVIAETVGN